MLPNSMQGRGSMSDIRRDSSEADVRLWAAGLSIGLPIPAEPAGGFGPSSPHVSGGGPSPSQLDVRSVRARGGATIEGQNLECEEVSTD
jgi:hypothetical protein